MKTISVNQVIEVLSEELINVRYVTSDNIYNYFKGFCDVMNEEYLYRVEKETSSETQVVAYYEIFREYDKTWRDCGSFEIA